MYLESGIGIGHSHNLNYIPIEGRIRLNPNENKQAKGIKELQTLSIGIWLDKIEEVYSHIEEVYKYGLDQGIPKELARIILPVGRYSRMRASANLRNWLSFLTLRMAPNAQYEIRMFAAAVGEIVKVEFPRTYSLFEEKFNNNP